MIKYLMLKEFKVTNSTRWLRISFWVGAIADALVGLVMIGEAIFAQPSPLTHYAPEIPYRYAIALAGCLMWGWTVLLLWADREPVQRRGVLLITSGVILGLVACNGFAMKTGYMPKVAGLSMVFFLIVLFALFTGSYWVSRSSELQTIPMNSQ